MRAVRSSGSGSPDEDRGAAEFGYDPSDGARTWVSYPNGTWTRYVRDARGQVSAVEHRRGGAPSSATVGVAMAPASGELLLGLAYGRDASGLVTSVTETGSERPEGVVVRSYGHDRWKRLVSESTVVAGVATDLFDA